MHLLKIRTVSILPFAIFLSVASFPQSSVGKNRNSRIPALVGRDICSALGLGNACVGDGGFAPLNVVGSRNIVVVSAAQVVATIFMLVAIIMGIGFAVTRVHHVVPTVAATLVFSPAALTVLAYLRHLHRHLRPPLHRTLHRLHRLHRLHLLLHPLPSIQQDHVLEQETLANTRIHLNVVVIRDLFSALQAESMYI
jgi:hypothetical protein